MTTGTRIRLLSGGFLVLCLSLLYAALWSMPAGGGRAPLYALAVLLPLGVPIGVTFIRRRTAAEVEAQRPPPPPLAKSAAGLTVDELLAIVGQSPLPVAILDRSMRYVAHSDRWLSAYRLDGPSLVGRHHYDVFPEVPGRWRVIHQACLAGATKHSPGERFPRADGRIDWIRWTVQPWHGTDGAVAGLIMLTEVITAEKEAEQALRARLADLEAAHGQLDAAAAVARLGYWIWHPTIGEFEVSSSVRQLLRSAEDPQSMDDLQARIPDDEREIFLARLRRAVLRGERFSHQVTMVCDDGERLRVRLAGHPERDAAQSVTRVFGVMLDATDEGPSPPDSAEALPGV